MLAEELEAEYRKISRRRNFDHVASQEEVDVPGIEIIDPPEVEGVTLTPEQEKRTTKLSKGRPLGRGITW